jgi:hypothetical protein
MVERTIALLHWFRRLRIRYERLPIIHEAFLKIDCSLVCWRFLQMARGRTTVGTGPTSVWLPVEGKTGHWCEIIALF